MSAKNHFFDSEEPVDESAEPMKIDSLSKLTMLSVQGNCELTETVRLGLGVTIRAKLKVSDVNHSGPLVDNFRTEVPTMTLVSWAEYLEKKCIFNQVSTIL